MDNAKDPMKFPNEIDHRMPGFLVKKGQNLFFLL